MSWGKMSILSCVIILGASHGKAETGISLPARFLENRGQWDAGIRFVKPGPARPSIST